MAFWNRIFGCDHQDCGWRPSGLKYGIVNTLDYLAHKLLDPVYNIDAFGFLVPMTRWICFWEADLWDKQFLAHMKQFHPDEYADLIG